MSSEYAESKGIGEGTYKIVSDFVEQRNGMNKSSLADQNLNTAMDTYYVAQRLASFLGVPMLQYTEVELGEKPRWAFWRKVEKTFTPRTMPNLADMTHEESTILETTLGTFLYQLHNHDLTKYQPQGLIDRLVAARHVPDTIQFNLTGSDQEAISKMRDYELLSEEYEGAILYTSLNNRVKEIIAALGYPTIANVIDGVMQEVGIDQGFSPYKSVPTEGGNIPRYVTGMDLVMQTILDVDIYDNYLDETTLPMFEACLRDLIALREKVLSRTTATHNNSSS